MQPQDFIKQFIKDHEGGLSLRPTDTGNWYNGVLVGSNYGVTAAALLKYVGKTNVPASVVKQEIAKLTLDTAADIGFQLYYKSPSFNLLVWNQVTASIVDKAWGSGPGQAIKLLQRAIGVADDGQLGPSSAAAYNAWISKNGVIACAKIWCDIRIAFDTSLVKIHPTNIEYINGWNNRSKSFLPGTIWWNTF